MKRRRTVSVGAVALPLAMMSSGDALVLGVAVVDLVTVDEHHHVGVLLDGSARTRGGRRASGTCPTGPRLAAAAARADDRDVEPPAPLSPREISEILALLCDSCFSRLAFGELEVVR